MTLIKNIIAREIFDSRGNPTIECDVILDHNIIGRSSVPSGASKGFYEAVELRDSDLKRLKGRGVLKAINNINNLISKKLIGSNVIDQNKIDELLISLDSTPNKSKLGANAILAVSMSCIKAAANLKKKFLYEYLGDKNSFTLPVPMMNIINGGAHADNKLDIQEFMIAPIGAKSFSEAMEIGFEIFHNLRNILKKKGYNTNVGDEGGFAPDLRSTKEAIELILESSLKSGYKNGSDIFLSLDVASNELFKNNNYLLSSENKSLTSDDMCDYLTELSKSYPIYSIEDGMAENDYEGWKNLTKSIGKGVQLVGDDLFVTNVDKLQNGIEKKLANSILIKPNQIGTISETIKVINTANKNQYSCIISHRSGETEDTTIADLSVAFNTGQIKTGSFSRTDRLCKYNQLLRIEENLGNKSIYAGNNILKFQN